MEIRLQCQICRVTGISIKTSGYGKVTSQNVEEGTTISTDTKIEVNLE